jgi:hypothetical protein
MTSPLSASATCFLEVSPVGETRVMKRATAAEPCGDGLGEAVHEVEVRLIVLGVGAPVVFAGEEEPREEQVGELASS